jgi:hypothetical protein
MQASWRQILGEVLAAEGAERTAHEVRDGEQSKADSLARLSAEYDYLAQLAAAEDLREFLEAHSLSRVSELQQSPSWGAAVAAWRRSVGVSRPSAERVVVAALEPSAAARDTAAVVHSRLRKFLSAMPASDIDPLTEQLRTVRPDLANMITQVRERMQQRMDHVTLAAMVGDVEWKRNLLEALGPYVTPEEATGVLRRTAIYRDRWGIENSPLPLGPVPEAYEWEQKEQRAYIDRLDEQAGVSSHSPVDAPTWADDPVTWEHRLINVGWQL